MDAVEAGHAAGCNRSGGVGRPKKYAQPWVSLAKRVYLEEGMFSSLRLLKAQYQFKSDDTAVRYLISRHEYLCAVERLVKTSNQRKIQMYYCSIAVPTSQPSALVANRCESAPLLGTPSAVANQSQHDGFFADTENLEAATQAIPIVSMECGAHTDDRPVKDIASPSRFMNDFDINVATSTPVRNSAQEESARNCKRSRLEL